MTRLHLVLPLGAALAALSSTPAVAGPGGAAGVRESPEQAVEEMAVGRFWHAARILRAEGAERGEPAQVLLLARAEAGWKNWLAVAALLEDRPWLAEVEGGDGVVLLGRALEEARRWAPAAHRYEEALAALADDDARRPPLLARLARARAGAGDMDGAVRTLDAISGEDVVVRSWAAVELAGSREASGDTALLARLDERIVASAARAATWRLVPDARLAAGDSAGAERGYREAFARLRGSGRGEAATEAGALTLARGDTAAARALFLEGVEEGPARSRGRAAAALLSTGETDRDTSLGYASLSDRAGDGASALRAYDRAARLSEGGVAGLPEWARLARARLMATVRARQDDAIEEFRAIHASTTDPDLGARNLAVWMSLRQRQGRTGDVATLRKWLLERFPESDQAAEIVWERASSAESRGELPSALRQYAELSATARTHARAGQARMRTGQIHFGAARLVEAADVYEAYLADFPEGRRWEEASFWAARSRLELGDSAAARGWIAHIRRQEPVSYYAVMGSALLGEPYDVTVPAGAPVQKPGWLTEGLVRLDRLVEAGLERGADAEEARLVGRARGSHPVMLTLAEALIDRGRTISGINLGWDLRREGMEWDRRLLEVVYPFPYRELVRREAAEWGVDPIMLAALIRQESAFKADIVSHAGAVGLMQVMPATGKDLAKTYGPAPFAEANLTTPEVNLHLGAAFFVEMNGRYGGDLPLVLSAYNAGPTRAARWRHYPELADPARFTERIPFDETRGYVKNVRRNLGLYQILYGEQQ